MTAAVNNNHTSALRRIIAQPAFMAAVVILAVAAVGLNASVGYLRLHFKKEAVPIARPLASIPTDLGEWQLVSLDEPLDPDIEHALGTNQYVFRDYMDQRVVGRDTIEQIRKMNESILAATNAQTLAKLKEDRAQYLGRVRMHHPNGVVNLAVTYYTGLVDTVAHVPDRCYVADGYEPKTWEVVNWNIDGGKPVEARFINFEDSTGRSTATRSVAYFFHVNGEFESAPESVRLRLQNLFERHGYYAKVEVMTLLPDRAESARVMTDFLSAAMPEIRKSLPDWAAVKRGDATGAAATAADGIVPKTNTPQ